VGRKQKPWVTALYFEKSLYDSKAEIRSFASVTPKTKTNHLYVNRQISDKINKIDFGR